MQARPHRLWNVRMQATTRLPASLSRMAAVAVRCWDEQGEA